MSCRRSRRNPLVRAILVAVLLALVGGVGCGRKGRPLPPLREPDPTAEAAADEAALAGSEGADAASDDGAEDEQEDDEAEPDSESGGGEDDSGPPP